MSTLLEKPAVGDQHWDADTDTLADLNGGDVLPGFSLSLRELFSELDALYGPTGQ